MDKKSLKPQLRFKGFTDAWEQRKFQDIFSFERPDNYIVKSDKYSNEYTMPVLTANKAFILGYTKENSPCTKTSLIFDDFTLECKYVDFPYMVKSSAIKILTVKDSKKDDLRFSFERLNTTKIEILGHARHYISVVQPTETKTPKIAEQNKISTFFSNLDNLITLHQRKLDKLSNVKKALLEKMFPKNDSDVPEIRFKGFTDAWEQRKLADTVKIRTGFPFDSSKFSDDGEFLVITNGNIKDEFSNVDDSLGNRINIQNNQIKQEYELTTDDILVTMDGTVGRTAKVVDSKQILAQRVGRLTATENKEFLYQALNTGSFFNEMSILSHGGTIKHISLSEIGSFEFSAPTKLLEQQKIGTFFSNLDNLITLHQRKLEKLKNIKKACLEKMFV